MDDLIDPILPPVSELLKDPFASTELEVPGNEPIEHRCELSLCDARYSTKGDRVYLHAGTRRILDAKSDPASKTSALLKTRFYDKNGVLEYTETKVQSDYIRTALKAVIGTENPQVDFNADTLVIREFEQCIFHYHKQLQEHGKGLTNETAIRHVDFVLQTLYRELGQEMQLFKNMVESAGAEPRLDFANLWMAFCPGDLVVRRKRRVDCLYRLVRTDYESPWLGDNPTLLRLSLLSLDFNGDNFGYVPHRYIIPRYSCNGYTRLEDLPLVPLKYVESSRKDTILQKAAERGEQFLELSTQVFHREYHGLAKIIPVDGDEPMCTKMISGRIVIDCTKCSTERPEHVRWLSSTQRQWSITETDEIPEKVLILARRSVTGFSLSTKTWCRFKLDMVKEIHFNRDAFAKLVLPPLQKEMVKALVTAHQKDGVNFDDIVTGKGKGIAILLHGTPGVGKTLTAESVAEFAKRPLYSITAADFSGQLSQTEQKLRDVLELASHWNAVLLIDEADVFLEQRSSASMERNAVVSIFLRTLEYYQGVLILTTNRVSTLDSAFKSRIHLGIKYHSLSEATRHTIWETFIKKASATDDDEAPEWLDDDLLRKLSQYEFDGRMIKNAVRMALALAVAEKDQLGPSHLQKAVEAMDMFERDMKDAVSEEKQDPGKSEENLSISSRKRQRVT